MFMDNFILKYKLFIPMSTINQLLQSLSSDSNERGNQFEIICKWFLENDPIYKKKIDKVWLWNDYPKRWGADKGIDLVCQFKDGSHWAIQSKCYQQKYSLKKSDIDSFLSESNCKEITGCLLIASTNNLGTAKRALKAQNVVCILLDRLEKSNLVFPVHFKDLYKVKAKTKAKPTPREHQTKAINVVVEGLATDNKCQLIMCCGSGKTFTALWIKEALKAQMVLVLVPSLSLLSQTFDEWFLAQNDEDNFISLCVCSDDTVIKGNDEVMSSTLELGFPVTTDEKEIERFLLTTGNKVVFCTYQSSSQIEAVQKNLAIADFDMVFSKPTTLTS